MKFDLRKIKDYCKVGDGAHASIKRKPTGVVYLTSKNFKDSGLDLSKIDFIDESDYKKHFSSKSKALTTPQVGDILLGIIGSIGTPYIVREGNLFGISSSVAILRPNKYLDSKYLYYFMTSDIFQNSVDAIKSGVAQGFLSLEMIRNIPIVCPPLPTQKHIADILSAYDELIENNNQRIAILEQMAEQIYKEWFVRFRFPGYENTKFVKGLPEGWEVRSLGKVIELAYGKSLPERERTEGVFPVYGSGGIAGTHDKYLIKGPGIIVGRKGTVGSIYFVKEHFFPIDTVFFVRTDLPLEYVYYNLLNQNFISGDAAVPGLKRDQAYANLFLVPNSEINNKFLKIISPFFNLKFNLLEQNKRLISARDLLLPRLISGKLSVESAEELINNDAVIHQEKPTVKDQKPVPVGEQISLNFS